MQKLKLIILTASIAMIGAGFTPIATATQPQLMGVRSVRDVTIKDVKSIALGKKCTIRRYRRPH